MKLSSIIKGMFLPLVATVSLFAGMSLVGVAPAGALNPVNILSGAVTDASSNPIVGLCVNLYAVAGGAPFDQTTTGSDGSYVMTGVPTGTYSVVTGCDGGGDGTNDSIYAQQTASVTMTSGTVVVPTITMAPGGGVSGTVEYDGVGVDGVCVDADPTVPTASEPSIGFSTSSNGEYTISGLAAASYDINVWSSSSAGPCTTDDQTVSVTITAEGVVTQDFSLASAPATTGTISGTITDSTTGDPVSGVCVDVIDPTSGATLYSTSTAADGTFSVSDVTAGTYSLNSYSGCGSSTIYASIVTSSVAVSAANTTTENVVMNPGGAISGTVESGATGDPISSVCVTATSTSSSFEVSSSTTGAYFLTGLPVDSYTVTVDPTCAGTETSAYNSASSTEEVTANSTSVDDITLTPTAPTVTPSSPSPPPVTTATSPPPPVTTPPVTTSTAPPTPTKPRVVTPGLRVVGVAHVGRSSELRIVGMMFSAPKKIVSNARDTTVRLVRDPKSYLLVRVIAGDKAPSGGHIITIVLHGGKKVRVSYTQDSVRKTSTTSPATTPTAPTTITPPPSTPTTPSTPTVTTPTTDTVSFDSEGGSSVASMTGAAGSTITLPSAPSYSGYNFVGWFTSPSGGTEASSPFTLTSSVTLYAQWTAAAPFQGAYSSNWSGYVLPVTDNSVTSVSGSWTVPTLNCSTTPNSSAAMWVGLNGTVGAYPLIQTGTGSSCSDGVQETTAWWEIVPSDPDFGQAYSQLAVSPGDKLSAKVYENASDEWVMQLQDLTTGLEGVSVAGADWYVSNIATGAIVAVDGTAAPYLYQGISSAEWIVESPTSGNSIETLADFGTTSFTNLQVNGSAATPTPQDAIDMFNPNGHVLTAESPVSDGAFSETYVGPVMAPEMGNVTTTAAGGGFSTREDW